MQTHLLRIGLFSAALLLAACSGDEASQGASQGAMQTPLDDVQELVERGAAAPAAGSPAGLPEPPAGAAQALRNQAKDPAMATYLNGLEYLRRGQYPEAAEAFSRSLQRLPDDPRMVLARAVAYLLAENFDAAKRDILRLPRGHRHAQVWNYAHSVMSGKMSGLPSVPEYAIESYESTACQNAGVAVPGHVIQGDKTFTTDYASHVVYRMARTYGQQRCNGTIQREVVAPVMLTAARWFAHMNMSREELLGYQVEKAAELLISGDTAGALTYANFAHLSAPHNAAVLHLMARAYLQAGQPETARRYFTRALAMGSPFAESYIGRALAAYRTGDQARGQADVAVAEQIDDDAVDDWDSQLDQARAAPAPAADPQPLLARLTAATKSPTPDAELLALAETLHRNWTPKRIRYDEVYQDRLRTLLADAQRNSRNPAGWVTLSRYLAQEAELRGESVEARRPLVPYRYQVSEKAEMQQALRYADHAISLDDRHVPALMMRAEILNYFGRANEAEALAERALNINPDDPQAATLYALFKGQRAMAMLSQAAALRSDTCTSSSHTEKRSDGVYRVTRRTCYPPTPQEIARARQLENQARILREQSKAIMRRAIDLTRGTYVGYLLQADVYLWQHDYEGAVGVLRQAAALDPADLRAHESLARILPRIGDVRAAAEHQIIVNRNLQTTAAPLLTLARKQIDRGHLDRAAQLLHRARSLDPQDARVPAYLGVIYEKQQQPDQAAAAFRLTMAMEAARKTLDGGPAVARHMDEYGLYLQAASRLADILVQKQDSQRAGAIIQQALAVTARLQPGWQAVEMYAGLLPGTDNPVTNGASLIAALHVRMGQHHQAAGQLETAKQSFRSAIALGPDPQVPNIISSSGSTNFAGYASEPVGAAMYGLANVHVEQGDIEGAKAALANLGYVKLPEHIRRQVVSLSDQLSRVHERQQTDYVQKVRPQDMQQIAGSLETHPALIGAWSYQPQADWRLMGGGGVYRFNHDGTYSFAGGNSRSAGRWGAMGNWQPIEVVTLLSEQGELHTLYAEQQADGHYVITLPNAAKYDLQRQR